MTAPTQVSTTPVVTTQESKLAVVPIEVTSTAPTAQELQEEKADQLRRANLGPMDSIKDLDKQVEAYHLGQTLSPQEIADNLRLKQRIIRGTFDIEELCRQSLDKHWTEITTDQQKHFVDLMTRLLEKKAIFSKEQLHGENKYYQIEYTKEVVAPDKKNATVYSRMVVAKRKMDLALTYKLVKKDAGWKIFDIIVDDAELLKNYRFQFDRIIQKGGYDDLVKRMEQKLTSIGTE